MHATAILAGWTLATWAAQDLVHARWDPAVWKASAGLFLLSVAGWRHLRTLFAAGLYRLWKGSRR